MLLFGFRNSSMCCISEAAAFTGVGWSTRMSFQWLMCEKQIPAHRGSCLGYLKKQKKTKLDGKKQVNITVHRAAFRLCNKHKRSVGTSGVTYCTYCPISFTLHATSNNISAESTVGINTIWDELIVCLYLHRHSLSILLIQQGSKMQTTVHLVSGHDWVTNSSV